MRLGTLFRSLPANEVAGVAGGGVDWRKTRKSHFMESEGEKLEVVGIKEKAEKSAKKTR